MVCKGQDFCWLSTINRLQNSAVLCKKTFNYLEIHDNYDTNARL